MTHTRLLSPLLFVILLTLGLLSLASSVQAATCEWTGATSSDWTDPGNWANCEGSVPDAGDTATVPDTGQAPVIQAGDAVAVAGLTIDPGVSVLVAGTLTLPGNLSGGGNLVVDGVMDWTGGTMGGGGTTTVTAGGTLNLKSTTSKQIAEARRLHNAGHLLWLEGDFAVGQLSTAVISNTGTFEIRTGGTFGSFQLETTATFVNTGTVIKATGSATTTVSTVLTFNNNGLVDIRGGALVLQTGATSTSSGRFQVAGPAALQFIQGEHTLTEDSEVTGAGDVTFTGGTVHVNGSYEITGQTTVAGGIANLNTDTTLATILLGGGTLGGSGELTITDSFDWTGGQMLGSGTTTIPAGAEITLRTTDFKQIGEGRDLNNAGRLLWLEGDFSVGQLATTVITNTGTFDIRTGGIFGSGQLETTATFINSGTLIKTAESATTSVQSVLTFNNNGLVDIRGGTLVLRSGATSTSGGRFQVAGDAALEFQPIVAHTLTQDSEVTGSGDVTFSGGTINLNGSYAITGLTTVSGGTANFNTDTTIPTMLLTNGTLGGSGNLTVTDSFDWTGGSMLGSGTTTIPVDAEITLRTTDFKQIAEARRLNNAGHLLWLEGDFIVGQLATTVINNTGTFEVRAGGIFGSGQLATTATFINNGTFIKTADGATTAVQSVLTFNNNGLVDIRGGALVLQTGATSTSSGRFQVAADATLEFQLIGAHTLTEDSELTGAGDVSFSGGTTNVDGAYDVTGQTAVNGGTARFTGSAAFADLLQNGGTLALDSPNASIAGTFTRNGGTFEGGTGTVLFNGSGDQELVLNVPTPFNNLAVAAGTRLIEVVAADHATINGSLANGGTIRKTEPVTGTGAIFFGLTGVTLDVEALGSLSRVQIDRFDSDHPAADQRTNTGRYWSIVPVGSGYTLAVTLPHDLPAESEPLVCRLGGSSWNCARDSATANTVTREGVTALSGDWAVGRQRPLPDLTLSKTASSPVVTLGDAVAYTLVVTNTGRAPATGVVLSDTLPAGVTFQSATSSQGDCSGEDTVVCELGVLPGGQSATVEIIVTPTSTGTLRNTAVVSANEADAVPSDNTATVDITVQQGGNYGLFIPVVLHKPGG